MAHDIQEGFWGDAGESIEAYYAVNDFVRQSGANSGSVRRATTVLGGPGPRA